MKRPTAWAIGTALALTTSIAVFAILGLQQQNRIIDGLHARFVQSCVMNTDEPQDECEGRWLRALNP